MRLSTAIGLGRTLCISTPQTQDDGHGGGCALGMAARAVGIRHMEHFAIWRYEPTFPVVDAVIGKLPCGHDCPSPHTVADGIAHIFNEHVHGKRDWTLDQLIDFVRSVEPPESEQASEPATEVQPCANADFVTKT